MYVLWVFIVNLQSQKSSRYFWKYFCLKNIDLGEQPESCEEKHISKSNEQFQLQNNEISTANISHLYSCNLHTTQLISHWSIVEKKMKKKMFYGQGFEGQIKLKFESVLYDFYFQNRSLWWYTILILLLVQKYSTAMLQTWLYQIIKWTNYLICCLFLDIYKSSWIVLDGF